MGTTKSKASLQEANDEIYSAVLHGEEPQKITYEEAFDIIAGANVNELFDLSTSYLKMEKGHEFVMLVLERKRTLVKGKEIDVVLMQNKQRQKFVAGDKLLVDAVKQLTAIPCFIRIKCLDIKESSQGMYRQLEIHTVASNVE